ncbi:MAG: TIGR02099 family protein [Halothiobacillus sp. 14-55-98]|nr:MAG: TIGR02099 family protein [Halothiobacillus sp. 14-55-98]
MTHIHLPHAIHLSSRPLRRLIRFLLASVAVILVLLALAFSVLRVVLPHMTNYREEAQTVLSKAWGAPVQFGSIDVAFVNYRPQLVLTDLRLGNNGPVISRFGVSLAPWRSLVARHWVAGKIVIDKPHLAFIQQANGKWTLSGAPQTSPQNDPEKTANSWADWLSRLPDLGDVSINEAVVSWIRPATSDLHESRQTINLNATARLAAHGWSLSGELFAPGFGNSPVRLRADGHLGDEPNAEVYLGAHNWNLPAMQQAIRDFTHGSVRAEIGGCAEHVEGLDCSAGMPLVNQGQLSGELWLRFAGTSLRSVSADFDISSLKVSRMAKIAGIGALASTQSQATLHRIGGRLLWQKTTDGWRLDADHVRVATTADTEWPAHSIHLIHAGDQTYYASSYVDLHQLAVWLATAPLPKSFLELLGQNALRGDARDIRLHLVGNTLVAGYLELQHFGNVPGRRLWPVIGQSDGLGGLNLKLYKQPSGWLARFDQSNLVLAVPGMFREPMTIDALKGDVYLHDADSGRLLIYSPGLRIKNADLFTDTSFRYQAADKDHPAQLAIDSAFGDIHVARVPAYLPRNLLGKNVLHWLDTNLELPEQGGGQPGRVDRGHFVFNGDPARFPFIKGGGWFSVVFDFKHLVLPFLPDWPALKDADGNIAFVNQQFHASIDHGTLADVPVDGSRVSIFDLDKAALDIAVTAKAPLSQLLGFVGQTPLLGAGSLNALKVTGQAGLDVSVRAGLKQGEKTDVNGHLVLKNNGLSLDKTPIKLSRISGAIDFHNADFTARNISARFDDEPATMTLKPSTSDDSTIVSLQTRLDPLFALREKSATAFGPLLDRVRGKADTTIELNIPHHGDQFTVQANSDLAGVSSQLPPPFGKAADAVWPLSADLTFTGGVLRQLDLKSQGGEPWQANLGFNDRGALSGGDVSNRADSADRSSNNSADLAINLNTPVLDWDAWQPILSSAAFSLPEKVSTSTPVAPFDLNIKTDRLKVVGVQFGPTRLNVRFADERYRIKASGDDLDGNLNYQQPNVAHPAGQIAMQFKRFHVEDQSSSNSVSSDRVTPISFWDLKQIPSAQVIIDDLRFGKHRLGKLVLNSEAAKPGHDMLEIPTIDWQPTASFRLIGQGSVAKEGDKQQTNLNLSAQGADLGAVFKQVGGDNSPISNGDLKSSLFSLSWPGSPAAFALERLSGSGAFVMQNGQLNEVNPGAGRLAGLLSLGAITRRLRLDFSDVVDQGLPFDSLSADWTLKQGLLAIDPLTLKNASLRLTASGQTHLSDNSLDYTVKVYADIGMLLPIIGTVAGGPIVGGAVLALQQALKTIDKNPAPTLVYRVTGTIADPVVKTADAASDRSTP